MRWAEPITLSIAIIFIAVGAFFAGRMSMPEYTSPNAYELRYGTFNSDGYYVYEVYRAELPKGILIVEDAIEYSFIINTNFKKENP